MRFKSIWRWLGRNKWVIAFGIGIISVLVFKMGLNYTSTDEFCAACHVHPHSTTTWKQGAHYDSKSGVVVHCVECHLPPGGIAYLTEKTKTGLRDVYGTLFKEIATINWDQKSTREAAARHVYEASCLRCHQKLYPKELSKKGQDAHLYYEQKAGAVLCINCHLETGHFHKESLAAPELLVEAALGPVFVEPAQVDSFVTYVEKIPRTRVQFEMIAIPGGSFTIGSAPTEPYRKPDEGPQRQVKISSFWMGKTEVSWSEYDVFLRQTGVQGRTEDQVKINLANVDAVTGPTPAYGNPDQGWGRGKRPAITMTHFAAVKYCEWLSKTTGKKYRLPTEAEWEYACRGNTNDAYFFPGDPRRFQKDRFWNRIFGTDTSKINRFVVFANNSPGKTLPSDGINGNPFGLVHMLGNVREFCLDWYSSTAFSDYPPDAVIVNPTGPESGTEYVIRGGSFKSDAASVRAASRDRTRHDAWMMTDPQMPKSRWWYSDCNDVGFRVVCEYEEPVQFALHKKNEINSQFIH